MYNVFNATTDYLRAPVKQMVLGNYTDDVTVLGTTSQVAFGFTGLDFLCDFRDISADFVKWKWSWGQEGKLL